MRARLPLLLLLLLLAIVPAHPAVAMSDCETASDDCVAIGWSFSLGLGLGSRSNPIVTGRDIPLVVIPKLSYTGKRFFIDNLDFGVTLYESASNTFNLVASPAYDRVFFYRNDLQNFFVGGGGAANSAPPGLPPPVVAPPTSAELILRQKRQVAYLAGPEWHFNYGGVIGQLDALYEVTGRFNGAEVRAAVAVPLIQSAGTLTAATGVTWKSGALVTYYYGKQGIYEAGSALNPFAKLSYTLPINVHWNINALAHIEWLDSAIAHSPIVFEQAVTTIFAGVAYSF